jgi:hypothetical protein
MAAWLRLGFVLLAASLGGCYHGEFLAGQPCTEDRDCGTVLSCNAGVCGDEPPEPPTEFELGISPIKQFDFEWAPADRADYYQLLGSAKIGAPYIRVGDDVIGLTTSLTVPLHLRMNASYKLLACNDNGCSESEVVDVPESLADAVGYFKAPNTDAHFGSAMALSADGNTLAVGAPTEAGVDESALGSGAVYVFERAGRTWQQEAHVVASITGWEYQFGSSVALSSDGTVLFVGAPGERSSATGIDGDQADESMSDAGAVYVFERNAQTWTQQAYVKASNTGTEDKFGSALAVAGANILAVGAPGEDSATGIDGNQLDESAQDAGAVYLFVRDSQAGWTQQAYIKASNAEAGDDTGDYFGYAVALSGDGSRLAVGAHAEDSSATNLDGDQADDSRPDSGAVYVFARDDQTWTQTTYVKASNTDSEDHFGYTVALSGDGNTLAIGARQEASSATDIDGNQADNSAFESGAVYVFTQTGPTQWSQQAYVKDSVAGGKFFGTSLALSGDGNMLVVGAYTNVLVPLGGSMHVFVRDGQAQWTLGTRLTAPDVGSEHLFGCSVAVTGDGNTLAVGAYGTAMNIGPNDPEEFLPYPGAVYLY